MSASASPIDEDPDPGDRYSGVSQKKPEALIGTIIDGRYRVDAMLGEGGMGLVYRVEHIKLRKTLAIKVLRSENTRDQEVLARFQREAQAASNIGNEHIVDIHDFGTLPDRSTYFVMECLEGSDLIDAIDTAQRLSEARAVDIAHQICVALGAAHDAGIVHRDLKPENVFLTRRGPEADFVKVLDFGIAKVANRPHRLTRDGEVLGTPHYMSPEQCAGDEIDHRTDIYALGVLLYEMVTGHVPHDADSMMAILTKQMYEDPVAPRVRIPAISKALEQIILRSLEKKPGQRYQTMHDMAADLVRLQQGERLAGPDTLRLEPPPRRFSNVKVLAAIAAALLLSATGLAFLLSSSADGPPAQTALEPSDAPTRAAPPDPQPQQAAEPEEARADNTVGEDTLEEAPAATRSERPKRRTQRREPVPPPVVDQGNGPILDPWK